MHFSFAFSKGVVNTLWSFDTLFETVRQYEGAPAW